MGTVSLSYLMVSCDYGTDDTYDDENAAAADDNDYDDDHHHQQGDNH